jgi:hypothetical protein
MGLVVIQVKSLKYCRFRCDERRFEVFVGVDGFISWGFVLALFLLCTLLENRGWPKIIQAVCG